MTLTLTRTVLVASLVLIVAPSSADERPARYWPLWRGADSSGSASSGAYAVEWNARDNLVWKLELPGIGGTDRDRR